MFNLIGISEKAGSGVDKMVNGWLDEYIAAPDVKELLEPSNVIWILPYVGLIARKDLCHIREVMGEQEFNAMDLWKKIILILIRTDNWISHNDISKVLPVHSAEISQRLSKLVQEGHVITRGRSRGTNTVDTDM